MNIPLVKNIPAAKLNFLQKYSINQMEFTAKNFHWPNAFCQRISISLPSVRLFQWIIESFMKRWFLKNVNEKASSWRSLILSSDFTQHLQKMFWCSLKRRFPSGFLVGWIKYELPLDANLFSSKEGLIKTHICMSLHP